MARLIPASPRTTDILDDALDLIEDHFRGRPVPRAQSGEELSHLLGEALNRSASPPAAEPVRIVRQFACTGGTLVCRALAAQPNVTLLSEVDPFNIDHLARRKPGFAPTDLIRLADSRVRPLDNALKQAMFLAALKALYDASSRTGRRLILREHSHGRFCKGEDWSARPSVADVVAGEFPARTAVTVRHPMDSWLSLNANEWRHFEPFTLDEYATRYLAFLDDCRSAPVFKYEAFVEAPDETLTDICRRLELPMNESWQALLRVITLTGDSGRRGSVIGVRERRRPDEETLAAARKREAFQALCARLDYASDA